MTRCVGLNFISNISLNYSSGFFANIKVSWYSPIKSRRILLAGDKKIIEFVKNQEHFHLFFDRITNLFDRMLGGFKDEGKDYITVAFGCTGGVHRSVVSSEMFFSFLLYFQTK